MIATSVRRGPRAVRTLCFLGASALTLIAATGPAHAQAFAGSPATLDGSVTYNRLTPGLDTFTVNAAGVGVRPPHTVILWSLIADFLPATNTALFRAPAEQAFSVLNFINFGGPDPILFNGIIQGRVTTGGNTILGGRVGFESNAPAGLSFGSTANISLGQLWLRSSSGTPLAVLWNGTLDTNAATLSVPIDSYDNGLWLENVTFSANSGTLGGNAGTWLKLENSSFDLKGASLTLASVLMRDSFFLYTEGTNAAPATRTLSQNWRFETDNYLYVDQGRSLTLSGALTTSGYYDIYKYDTGLLTLTGSNAGFDSNFIVNLGELRVNSALVNGDITTQTDGTLSGFGTVRNVDASNGGTISPGNGASGVGTLTITGDLSMGASAALDAQVTPGGADRLTVQGLATLAGTLRIIATIGNYGFDRTFTLVSAPGTAGNFFSTVTGLNFGPGYTAVLTQNANGVTLRLIAQDFLVGLSPTDGTGNQRGTLGMIDSAVDDGDAPASLGALIGLSDADLLAAADALSGEAYATSSRVALDDERLVREAALGRLRVAKGEGTAMWGQVYGAWGKGQSDGNAASYDRDTNGLAAGIDTTIGHDLRVGVLVHHGKSNIEIGDRASNAEIERTGAGLYGAMTAGGFRLSLGGVYSTLKLDVDRNVAFPGFSETLNGETDGTALQGFGEIAYRFDLSNGALEPFVQASITSVDFDAFTETGGDAALTVADQSHEITSVIAGLRAEVEAGGVHLGGMIGYRSLSGDTSVATLVALDASPANQNLIGAAALDKSAIVASFDASYALSESASLSLGYSGVFADSGDDHAAKATFNLKF